MKLVIIRLIHVQLTLTEANQIYLLLLSCFQLIKCWCMKVIASVCPYICYIQLSFTVKIVWKDIMTNNKIHSVNVYVESLKTRPKRFNFCMQLKRTPRYSFHDNFCQFLKLKNQSFINNLKIMSIYISFTCQLLQ